MCQLLIHSYLVMLVYCYMSTEPKKVKKQYNVKPKLIHRKVVKNLTENHGNMSKAMIDAGYSEMTAKKPSNVTESKGFQQALREAGLTEEFLNNCLYDDIQQKPKNRYQELQLAYKLHGKLRDDKQGDKTLILITSGETASRYNLTPHNEGEVND